MSFLKSLKRTFWLLAGKGKNKNMLYKKEGKEQAVLKWKRLFPIQVLQWCKSISLASRCWKGSDNTTHSSKWSRLIFNDVTVSFVQMWLIKQAERKENMKLGSISGKEAIKQTCSSRVLWDEDSAIVECVSCTNHFLSAMFWHLNGLQS